MNEWDRIEAAKRRIANGIVRCEGANRFPVDKRVTNGKGVCVACGDTYTVTRYDKTVRTHYVKKGA